MDGLLVLVSTLIVAQMGIFGFILTKGTPVWRTYVKSWKLVGAAFVWFFEPFFTSKK